MENILRLFIQALSEASFNEFWHIGILQMLSEEIQRDDLSNCRPIAILQIFYKIFSKIIYNRTSWQLF